MTSENKAEISKFCSLLEKNNADEREAIQWYYELLSTMEAILPIYIPKIEEYRNQVREFISDEMNHSEQLSKMVIEISDIKPAID